METNKLTGYCVANGDEHYSPVSIAGLMWDAGGSLKASNNHRSDMFVAFSDGILKCKLPSDSRWAILFVAVGDKNLL